MLLYVEMDGKWNKANGKRAAGGPSTQACPHDGLRYARIRGQPLEWSR